MAGAGTVEAVMAEDILVVVGTAEAKEAAARDKEVLAAVEMVVDVLEEERAAGAEGRGTAAERVEAMAKEGAVTREVEEMAMDAPAAERVAEKAVETAE